MVYSLPLFFYQLKYTKEKFLLKKTAKNLGVLKLPLIFAPQFSKKKWRDSSAG